MTTEEKIKKAVEIIHNLRANLEYGVKTSFFNHRDYDQKSYSEDHLAFHILSALHDDVPEAAQRMAELVIEHYNPKTKKTANQILGFDGWNAPKHPIRNFLIVIRFDYPIKN